MELRSLGYRTALMFVRFDGSVIDRGDYIVARSPKNPGFYWGNFLLFGAPPTAADIERWPAIFAREFADANDIRHLAFGWDARGSERGAASDFAAAGFIVDEDPVFTMEKPPPPPPSPPVEIRSLTNQADWARMRALNIAADPDDGADNAYGLFKQRLCAHAIERWFKAVTGSGSAPLPAMTWWPSSACSSTVSSGDFSAWKPIQTGAGAEFARRW